MKVQDSLLIHQEGIKCGYHMRWARVEVVIYIKVPELEELNSESRTRLAERYSLSKKKWLLHCERIKTGARYWCRFGE